MHENKYKFNCNRSFFSSSAQKDAQKKENKTMEKSSELKEDEVAKPMGNVLKEAENVKHDAKNGLKKCLLIYILFIKIFLMFLIKNF